MKIILLVVLLITLLLANAEAKLVFLNGTAIESGCTLEFECWFFNASLWDNGTIPEANDEVYIQSSVPPGRSLFLNSSIDLSSIIILTSFSLSIAGNANVSIADIDFLAPVHLTLHDQAQIYALQDTNFVNGSVLSINGGAFAQAGASFFLDNSSSIYVFNNGYLGLHALTVVLRGNLEFSATSMFTSSGGLLEFVNVRFTFPNSPIIYNVSFVNSSVTFQQGWRSSRAASLTTSYVTVQGAAPLTLNSFTVDHASTLAIRGVANVTLVSPNITGTLFISSSAVNVVAPSLSSTLIIGGKTTINATEISFGTISFGPGETGEAANFTVNAGATKFFGNQFPIDFPQATVNAYDFAYFRGAVHVEGLVNVGQTMLVEDASLSVHGGLNIGYINEIHVSNTSSLTVDEAQLTVEWLIIGDFGTLVTNYSEVTGNVSLRRNATLQHHSSIFTGHLFNHGSISVHGMLSVGNYTQVETGELLSYVDLANRSSGYINAAGSASIDGSILYSVINQPHNSNRIQLAVVQAGLGLTGKFKADPVDISNSQHKGSVTYSKNDAYLVFGKSDSKDAVSLWWVWFIVAVGIIAVVGLVLLLLKTMRRKEYTPVQ